MRLLSLVLLLAAVSGATKAIDRIVVVHRHGARTPLVNISGACGNEKCGALTPNGAGMLYSLGKRIRQDYGDILPNWYDPHSAFESMADWERRTEQSSAALLKGIFAYNASLQGQIAVAIKTEKNCNPMDPTECPVYLMATAALGPGINQYAVEHYLSGPNALVTPEVVQTVAVEIGVPNATCIAYGAFTCWALVHDWIKAQQSNVGNLNGYPLAKASMPAFDAAANAYFELSNWGYAVLANQTAFFDVAGRPGSMLASSVAGTMKQKSHKVFTEWSGHDTTLMPLYVAMGNVNFVANPGYPVFASALIFEGWVHSDGKRWVRARVGAPDQLPGTGWPYNLTWYPLQCVDAHGTEYQPSPLNAGCPVEDFEKAVNRYTPRDGALGGICYAPAMVLAANNCSQSMDAAPMPETVCSMYRTQCTFTACGESRYMTPDLGCASVTTGDL